MRPVVYNVELKATKEFNHVSPHREKVWTWEQSRVKLLFSDRYFTVLNFSPILKQVFISRCQSVELYSFNCHILNKMFHLLENKGFKLWVYDDFVCFGVTRYVFFSKYTVKNMVGGFCGSTKLTSPCVRVLGTFTFSLPFSSSSFPGKPFAYR